MPLPKHVLAKLQTETPSELFLGVSSSTTVNFSELFTEMGAKTNLSKLTIKCCFVMKADLIELAGALNRGAVLKELALPQNRLGADDVQAFIKALGDYEALTSVDFSQCDIGAEGAAALARNTRFVSVNLYGNNIGAEGATAFAGNTTLKSLNLEMTDSGDEGAIALAANTSLRELDVSSCGIGEAGVKALLANRSFEILNLSGNHQASDEALASVAENTTLKSLDLSICNGIGVGGANALARMLASEHCSLATLNLKQNRVRDAGACVLVKALKTNTSLHRLDLTFNNLMPEGEGVRAFKELLENDNFTLCTLDLPELDDLDDAKGFFSTSGPREALRRNWKIRAAIQDAQQMLQDIAAARGTGGTRVSESEADNKDQFDQDLKTLIIAGRRLQDALESVGNSDSPNALKVKKRLRGLMEDCGLKQAELTGREIYLSYIERDDDGVKAIAANLAQNTKWEKLYLNNNPFGPKGIAALAAAAEENTTLVVFEIGKHKTSADTERLFAAIQRNRDVQAALDYAAKVLDTDATTETVDANDASAASASTAEPDEAVRKLHAALRSIVNIESPSAEITQEKLTERASQIRRLQAGESAPAGTAASIATVGGPKPKTEADAAAEVGKTLQAGATVG